MTTSACGAADSLVVNGETGFVIPPDDPEALCHAIRMLLNEDLRSKLGVKAKKICLKLCDPIREVEGYCRAIELALEKNK